MRACLCVYVCVCMCVCVCAQGGEVALEFQLPSLLISPQKRRREVLLDVDAEADTSIASETPVVDGVCVCVCVWLCCMRV